MKRHILASLMLVGILVSAASAAPRSSCCDAAKCKTACCKVACCDAPCCKNAKKALKKVTKSTAKPLAKKGKGSSCCTMPCCNGGACCASAACCG